MIADAVIAAGVATILIVDDTPVNLGVMVDMLGNCGYRVIVAQDGEEGLQRAAFVKPELILLDVMMPGMDGFEVCRRLKNDPGIADIPVIFMTSLAEIEHKITGFKAGGVDYVTKPIQVDEVIARVGMHIRLRIMQRQLEAQNELLQIHQAELELRVAHRTAELSASNLLLRTEIDERKRLEADLQSSEILHRSVVTAMIEGVVVLAADGVITSLNPAAEKILGLPAEQALGKSSVNLLQATIDENGKPFPGELHPAMVTLRTGQSQFDVVMGLCHAYSDIVWISINSHPLLMDGEASPHSVVMTFHDITERKQHEAEEKTRLRIYEGLAQGGELLEILDLVVKYVEQVQPDCFGNIMLLDAEGVHLQSIASPSLPKDFTAAIDGIPIGQGVGSCGTAAWRGETVIAEDIRIHPYWAAYKHLALQAGLLSCWSCPIFDSTGKVLGVLGVYRRQARSPSRGDMELLHRASHFAAIAIERRQIEERLRASEREFRTLAEHSPDMVARYDLNCRYLYCNPQLLELAGRSLTEVLGRTPLELHKDESVRCYQDKIEEVLRTRGPAELLYILPIRPYTRKIYDHVRFTPEFDASGQLVSVLAVGRDIGKLKEIERRMGTLIDNLPDFVMRLDTQGRYLYVSPAVTKAFGATDEHFFGKTAVEIGVTGSPGCDQELLDSVMKCVRDGASENLKMTFRYPAGDRVYHIQHVPEYDDFGQVESVLAVARDMTSLLAAHQELDEKKALLRSLIDSIPDFIFFKDIDSVYLGFNKAFADYCGYSEAELIGKTDHDFVPAHLADFFRQRDLEMLASGGPCQHDDWVTFPDGRRVLLNTLKSYLYDADGRIIGIIGVSRDITERNRLEQELIKREREFRTLAENAPDNIIRYDRETRVLYMNPSLERAMGITLEQAVGKRKEELFAQDEVLMRYLVVLKQVIASGERAQLDMIREPPGSSPRHYLVRFAPELDDQGQVVGVIAISRDYTEQKRLELELTRREREFRTLAENSPDVIVRYDRECRRIYFNQAFTKIGPAKEGGALGKTPLEYWWLVSPDAEEYTERLQQAMDTGEMDELVVVMEQEDQQAFYTLFLVPEFDENNRVASLLAIGHDITGIKRMEAMLRKSELEFRTLAQNSPEMIVRYDRDCRHIYINPAYQHQTGIPVEEAWNKTPEEVCGYLMSCEEYTARLKCVMECGEPDRILLEWHGADGGLVSHEMHAVAEYSEEGHVIGALVMGHNITELKVTERRLEESRAQLRILTAKREEAREEERKRIAREIHDELGQLLNVLRLNVTTLDYRYGDTNPDLRGKTQKMVGTVDRAILMVRNLATRLRPAVLSSGIVSALEWLVQEYAESTGIVCSLDVLTDEVPLDEDRAMVVFRIVQESLTNVLRHAGADRVYITLSNEAGICRVEVRDNGKGFDLGTAGRRNSFGIVGMRERAMILKGTLDIAAAETGGTVLKLCIPIDELDDAGIAPEHG